MGEYADDEIDRIMDHGVWGRGAGRNPYPLKHWNQPLAARRVMAHNAFDPIWESGEMSRSEAYQWLADQLGIPKHRCHMEQMNIAMCDRVIDICTRRGFADLIK